MNGVAVFNLAFFLLRYPEFTAVNPGKLQAYFYEAGLYLSNEPTSPVRNVMARLVLLNMLVAHISYLNGDTEISPIVPLPATTTLLVSSPNPGAFTVAHGLPVTPDSIEILMTSSGAIWQVAVPDATNLYLSASDVDVSANVSIFQDAQAASTGGQPRPVGRVSQASEGSVSASFDYGAPATASEAWYTQSPYGAAFWQATVNLRGMHYVVRPRFVGFRRGGYYQ